MRYTFVNDGDKEALLKRSYRRFQIVLGAIITPLVIFLLAFPACVHSHGGLVVLVFTSFAVAFALYERSRRKRDGIMSAEWQSYLWRQPMMIAVSVIMAISVIVHLYQVIFLK